MNHGLRLTRWDKTKARHDLRHLSRRKKFGVFGASTALIPDFDLAPNLIVKDQGGSYMCTAFANSSASAIQEAVDLSPEYAFQKTNELMGQLHATGGADYFKALKVHQKFGCIEASQVPAQLQLDVSGQYVVENPQNWTTQYDVWATAHQKKAYLKCDQGDDLFDSILVAMYQSYQAYTASGKPSDLRAVSAAFSWLNQFQYASGGVVGNDTSQPTSAGSGHNIFFRGKKTIDGIEYLIVQNSYGVGYGDKGLFYFPRAVVNKYCFFANTFEDLDPDEERANQYNFIQRIFTALVNAIRELVKANAPKEVIQSVVEHTVDTTRDLPVIPPESPKQPVESIPVPKYAWDSPKAVECSIRAICVEEKVDPDLAVRVATAESSLNPKASNVRNNKPPSTDRGLYMWNSHWHPEVSDAEAYDPEKATRLFCKAVRNGNISWWNSSKHNWA